MTAAKTLPAPAVTVASAKPPPKPAVKAPAVAAKPAPDTQAYSAPYPTYGNASGTGAANSAGNVMVIKSPALADPEVASTRVRP